MVSWYDAVGKRCSVKKTWSSPGGWNHGLRMGRKLQGFEASVSFTPAIENLTTICMAKKGCTVEG